MRRTTTLALTRRLRLQTFKSALQRLTMTLMLVMLTTMTAWAEDVETYYVDANGTRHDVTATVLTGGGKTELAEGTYLVNSDIEYTGTITLGGDVNIILGDGKTMTVANSGTELGDFAIHGESKTLHIYGQSQGTGALTATAVGGANTIFIVSDKVAGSLIGIHGGVVTASTEYEHGVGIGVRCSTETGGIIIDGGRVTASGGNSGISCSGGHFDILGGQVTATGTNSGGLVIYDLKYTNPSDKSKKEINQGVLTLGWSKPTDFISTNRIFNCPENEDIIGEVKIAAGKVMTDGTNIYDDQTPSATLEALTNATLRPAIYTVTFDSNGGSAVDAQTMLYGEKATAPDSNPTMEGGTFLGWTLNGADYDFDSAVTDNITLVAKWSVTTYYVDENGTTHDNITATTLTGGGDTELAGGMYLVNSDIEYTGTITLGGDVNIILADGKTMTVNTSGIGIYGGADNVFSSKNLTICGQTAQGGTLSVTAGGEGIWCRDITINSGTVNANTTGKWRTITANNLLTINGGVVTATNTANDLYAISGDIGLSINGGQVTATGNSGNIDANSLTFGYKNTSDFITFKGISSTGTVKIADGKAMTDGTNIYDDQTPSATLKALTNKTLRPVTIWVYFHINYSGVSDPTSQKVCYGLTVTEPTIAARMGYIFGGWYTDSDFTDGSQFDFTAPVSTTSNIYLYAKWTPITYYVEFDKNNAAATGEMTSVTATYDQWTSIPACTFTAPTGYVLKEWNRQADGSGDSFYAENGDFRNLTNENGATVTLYAQWGKDLGTCTADVPDPIYHSYSYHGYFYDGTWNDNHGGIKVYDGETLLTYGTDYQYKMMESLDDGSCENLGENCRVYLEGLGAYAGILYKDVVIVPATVTNATWGSLTWNLDGDGNFTISGTGAMKSADNYYSYPWYNYGSYFTTITIGENITTVAAAAFGGDSNTNNYSGVTSVKLPSTLTSIGEKAFAYCTGATFNADNLLAQGVTIGEDALHQVGCIVGTLQDNRDNSNMISLMASAATADVTIKGRTLYKDGNWNTICLPFRLDADQIAASPLAGATIMALDVEGYYDADGTRYTYYNSDYKQTSFDTTDGTLYLYFKPATEIEDGTPYLIKWSSGEDITADLTFDNVKVIDSPHPLTSEDRNVSFVGTFSPVPLAKDDKSNLFIGVGKNDQSQDVSTLYWPDAADYSVGAFRGYFHVGSNATVRAFSLNFGDDETTGIISTTNFTNFTNSDAWYDLSGRKLNGKPTKKGLYIHNGIKVAIK